MFSCCELFEPLPVAAGRVVFVDAVAFVGVGFTVALVVKLVEFVVEFIDMFEGFGDVGVEALPAGDAIGGGG